VLSVVLPSLLLSLLLSPCRGAGRAADVYRAGRRAIGAVAAFLLLVLLRRVQDLLSLRQGMSRGLAARNAAAGARRLKPSDESPSNRDGFGGIAAARRVREPAERSQRDGAAGFRQKLRPVPLRRRRLPPIRQRADRRHIASPGRYQPRSASTSPPTSPPTSAPTPATSALGGA